MKNNFKSTIRTNLHSDSQAINKTPTHTAQSWQDIHQQFSDYGRNAKEWIKKCQMLLPEIEKQQIWKKKGFSSIYVYAYQLAGMNENQVTESLRVLNKISDKPALMKIFEEKGLQRVRPIAAIATIETQEFWAEKAKIMPKNSLEAYVHSYRLQCLPREDIPSVVSMDLNPEIADKLKKLKGQGDWNELMKKFIAMYEKNFEENKPKAVEVKHGQPIIGTSSQAIPRTKAIGPRTQQTQAVKSTSARGSRTIPSAIKKHVLAKTNSTCAFPGCTKFHKILHHTDRFAMYHIHDPDHIIPLCEAHERLAHLGLIENENMQPQFWKLRTQPDYDNPKYEVDQIVEKYRSVR